MITVGMNYKVIAGKQQEFEDKFASVLVALRAAGGHVESSLYRKIDDDSTYLILSEWADQGKFAQFLRSDSFRSVTDWGKAEILADRPRHTVYKV